MVTLDKDALRVFGREVAMFLPDLIVMLRRVVADPRVPHSAKVEAAAALAYLVSPKNRLTNAIPVVGQLDDVAIIAFAFRRLVVGAGEPILREHWRGSERSFQILIGASSALASPAGAIRKAKLARSLALAGFEKLGGRVRSGGGAAGPAADRNRIVDGVVLDRGESPVNGGSGRTPDSRSEGRRTRPWRPGGALRKQ